MLPSTSHNLHNSWYPYSVRRPAPTSGHQLNPPEQQNRSFGPIPPWYRIQRIASSFVICFPAHRISGHDRPRLIRPRRKQQGHNWVIDRNGQGKFLQGIPCLPATRRGSGSPSPYSCRHTTATVLALGALPQRNPRGHEAHKAFLHSVVHSPGYKIGPRSSKHTKPGQWLTIKQNFSK